MTQADGMEQWKHPNEGVIYVNTDAALFKEFNSYSYSRLARNHKGELVEAVSSCRQGSIDPTVAEAIIIREAMGQRKSMVTGDNKNRLSRGGLNNSVFIR